MAVLVCIPTNSVRGFPLGILNLNLPSQEQVYRFKVQTQKDEYLILYKQFLRYPSSSCQDRKELLHYGILFTDIVQSTGE